MKDGRGGLGDKKSRRDQRSYLPLGEVIVGQEVGGRGYLQMDGTLEESALFFF